MNFKIVKSVGKNLGIFETKPCNFLVLGKTFLVINVKSENFLLAFERRSESLLHVHHFLRKVKTF